MSEKDLSELSLEALMKLLPFRTHDIRDTVLIGRASDNRRWSVVYQDHTIIDESPKTAVIRLLKELGIA